ncbi:MAG TPA: NucA/NucB deoxyribonuclease domain-containing protein [Candidatus Limnocylindrales bacterium]
MTLALSLTFGQPAAAEEPATETVPPLAASSGGALLGQGFKGDSESLAQIEMPTGQPKTAPMAVEAARLEAKRRAVENNNRTFFDVDEAEAEAEAAQSQAGIQASQSLLVEGTPPAAETNECLSRDGANTPDGYWLNRFMWCQRYRLGNSLYRIDPPLNLPVFIGTITMEYTAVVVGRKDDRSVRVYFKATPGSVLYEVPPSDLPAAPQMSMTIDADCEDTGCNDFGTSVTSTWSLWNVSDLWWWWDIQSDETASSAPDKVLYHNWFFSFHGSGGGYQFGGGSRTPSRMIRCDSANYFQQFGVEYPKACINAEVIPHIQYSVGSEAHGAVARHIKTAQNMPNSTYPIEDENKSIPGKYTGNRDDPGLHRIDGNGATAQANRNMKNAACNRTAPYNDFTGMPAYDTSTHDCDEYPFASTEEGAWTRNFSVRAVPLGENRSAGGSLLAYYFGDRILYNSQDEFWVEIQDCVSCGGGGGTGTIPDNPPHVDAGSNRTGDEGTTITLNGLAYDDFSTPSVSWSYSASSAVDAGTSCVFGDSQSARTSFTCNDDGVFTVTLTASDGFNPAVSDSATVTVLNAPPRITSLTPSSWSVYRVGTSVPVKATFTDAANDTHTCEIGWDDSSTSYFVAQNHACETTYVYTQAGMYTVEVRVTDDDGATATAKTLIVVYDPQGGFATAGAHYFSEAGALRSSTGASGKMRVEMNPQYQQNEAGPSLSGGRVSLNFDGGAFALQSTRLDWLVVTPDAKVAVKGEGTVNGVGGYGFVAYGYDDPSKLRVVVWSLADGPNPGSSSMYDNRIGGDYDLDLANPQVLDGGSLQVHQ